jgi:ATP-binding cassette subfamily B protein
MCPVRTNTWCAQFGASRGYAIRATAVLTAVKDARPGGSTAKSDTRWNGTITAIAAGVAWLRRISRELGAISIGKLVVCYSYLARLSEPTTASPTRTRSFRRACRASGVCRSSCRWCLGGGAGAPLPVRRPDSVRLECRRISFAYRDRRAISDLTFDLSAGERISIAGRSGAGKSTAAKVIARLYDPQSGTVSLNGEDVRSIDLKQLRRLIHYMPQHAVLFTGTVEDNLRYGDPEATDADVRRAVELAYLEPVIRRMPRGLSEMLGPGGCHVSGGERQRLALGRAILQRPRVLILDEATAFLDAMLEQTIFENLKAYLPETTLVLISHRLSALTWVDRHLLLDRGVLVASGSHAASTMRALYIETSITRRSQARNRKRCQFYLTPE